MIPRMGIWREISYCLYWWHLYYIRHCASYAEKSLIEQLAPQLQNESINSVCTQQCSHIGYLLILTKTSHKLTSDQQYGGEDT